MKKKKPKKIRKKAYLKGNIVIPPPFKKDGKWYEWIPWDEV